MVDYSVEFERRYNRISQFKMELLDAVLAFKLLDTVGINVKGKQLVLIACPGLTFDNMKAALKRIFGDNTPQRDAGELQVSGDAADAAYYTQFAGRRESRSNQQCQTAVQGTNLLDRYGRRTTLCSLPKHISLGKGLLPQK